MGNLCGNSATKDELSKTKQIEQMSRQMQDKDSSLVKLLLLGAGESGKSTLFKQMKILYGNERENGIEKASGTNPSQGFSSDERKNMRVVVHQNVLFNFKQLLIALDSQEGGFNTLVKENREVAEKLAMTNTNPRALRDAGDNVLNSKFAKDLLSLWSDPVIEGLWKKRGNLQVQDALEYYMNDENIMRIANDGYLPNDQDILRSRVRTSGIVEEEFKMNGTRFLMVDVGGQRNERRKWVHAFDGVDCVIFVAAISEFNQVLYEDTKVRRQDESVQLFYKVANEPVFKNHGLVLFLNKCDLFRKKLLTIPFRLDLDDDDSVQTDRAKSTEVMKERNTDYTGVVLDPESEEVKSMSKKDLEKSDFFNEIYAQSLQYLEELYKRQVPPGKHVYVKTTCATDTQQVQHIMEACRDIFLKKHLRYAGFA